MHSLSQKIQSQQFHPSGLLGILINPFYLTRRGLLTNICDLAPHIRGKVLDAGCGQKPYQKLFSQATEYIGMDYPAAGRKNYADVFYDGKKFPFADKTFDSVVSTEVLEHVFNPEEFIGEISRTLKPGGTLLMTMPFVWDEHEQPHDYARYSSFGIDHLLHSKGLNVIEHRKTNSDLRAIFQLINCYIYKVIPFKNYKMRLLVYLITTAPITLVGLLISAIFPSNNDFYLSNVILARKK
jgi:SAM-dependent methyltransferase